MEHQHTESETRVCTRCHKEYPATLEHFRRVKNTKLGLTAECKLCLSERHKQWREQNPEKYNAYYRGMKRDPERQKGYERAYRQRKRVKEASLRQELQALRAQTQTTQQPLDAPDSTGFWAWEEGDQRGVSEVYAGFRNELIVDEEPGGLTADYFSGRKWYRLTMPWEVAQ